METIPRALRRKLLHFSIYPIVHIADQNFKLNVLVAMEGYDIYEILFSRSAAPICQDDIGQISQKRTVTPTVAGNSEFHTIAVIL